MLELFYEIVVGVSFMMMWVGLNLKDVGEDDEIR